MKQVRMNLLENAYDFLNEALRSAERAGQDPQAWKFAVLHVVQAIELLLKARLQAEHPVLTRSGQYRWFSQPSMPWHHTR
jgi:HEPN domain-containing protein